MPEFIKTIAEAAVRYFGNFREIAGGVLRPALPAFYVIAILISGALLWLTIYCIAASGYMKTKMEKGMDYFGFGSVAKFRQIRVWKHVVKRMQTNDMTNWKLAIMEADELMDEVIKASGYRGANADERFQQVTPEVLSNIDQVKEAHRTRNRAAQEPDFVIIKDEALQTLRVYKKAFQDFGLLD